jgi:phosphatidylserine decarboxylase
MAKTLENWLESEVAPMLELDNYTMAHREFFRDPPRPQFIDRNFFFSPADGIIIYQKEVKDNKVVEVKGEWVTLEELTQIKGFVDPCLVIGIFMSLYNVHVNRIPMGGFLQYEYLSPVTTRNLPMLLLEKSIMDGKPDLNHAEYLRKNERVMNEIYVPHMDYTYYLMQIADVDVNAITPFEHDQNEVFSQNDRFSFIRWGSENVLILPLDSRYKFTPQLNETNCVKAGLDRLVKVERV